jgi:hypothetical protein
MTLLIINENINGQAKGSVQENAPAFIAIFKPAAFHTPPVRSTSTILFRPSFRNMGDV